jgi:lipid-binding SYLF domain-containing protein
VIVFGSGEGSPLQGDNSITRQYYRLEMTSLANVEGRILHTEAGETGRF